MGRARAFAQEFLEKALGCGCSRGRLSRFGVAEKVDNFRYITQAMERTMRHTRGTQMKGTHHFVAIGVLMFLMMTGQALADCVLNGKRLPEGTRIGSLVCEYGQWVEKPEKP